ncbi:MAG: hypothetical protein LJF30_12855 [Acidobacteria bacterium]|jgi:hypothetical protein|nr:hypothetical protein [Acidobacteriota bacterium]
MAQVKSLVSWLLDGLKKRWLARRQARRRGRRRVLGSDAGKVWIADDFDDPLPPEIQKYFE